MSGTYSISLEGRVALVTGASSGIGAGIARALGRSGAFVACCARRKDRLDVVAKEICDSGGKAESFAIDVSDERSITNAFDSVEARAGVVDIVVCSAGIVGAVQQFGEYSRQEWDRVMAVNLDGAYYAGRVAAERLIRVRKSGSIINIVSTSAGPVASGHTAYCVSKAACLHLTRMMAIDLIKHGIRVNAISPGMFVTEIMTPDVIASKEGQFAVSQIPIARAGYPGELGGIAVLLASDEGSYFVGTNIVVDGGQTIHMAGF